MRLSLACLGVLVAGTGGVATGAEWFARWSFERSAGSPAAATVRESEARSGAVILPSHAELGPGRFGLALWSGTSRAAGREWPRLRVNGDDGTPALDSNPADLPLNLGAHDWTLECWLRLEPGAGDEAVIFEIGTGPPGAEDFVTRCSVVPRENAFVFGGIVRVAPGEPAPIGRRLEFNDPAGPPHGEAYLDSVSLPAGRALPRERWFHVALVHGLEERTLRLFLDGHGVATAPARFSALPRGPRAYLALGCDGRRSRVLRGALDDLRVSREARYREDFSPPGPAATPAAP